MRGAWGGTGFQGWRVRALPRAPQHGHLCSTGAGAAVAMAVVLVLWLLLGQATGDPCYDPGGRPRFCLPPVTQLASGPPASCPQACVLSQGTSPRALCNDSLILALGGTFLLTSVSLRFCTPGPPALVLSSAWAAGGPWKLLWRRPAWSGALGGPERVTFRPSPGPKSRVVASHLRVEVGGWTGLAAAGVRGRCQCHGHAARCAARAQPPRCRCRHHTTGPGCESCRPSHRDWPWRPATPRHPHPCLRESWVWAHPAPQHPGHQVPMMGGGGLKEVSSLPLTAPLLAKLCGPCKARLTAAPPLAISSYSANPAS